MYYVALLIFKLLFKKYTAKILYGEIEIKQGHKTPYIAGITLVPISHYVWQ